MALLDAGTNSLHLNLALFGPGLSGKTTMLKHLQARALEQRHPTSSLQGFFYDPPGPTGGGDQVLVTFFVHLSDLGTYEGRQLVFHLTGNMGETTATSARKALLAGVDGVVFVADSQRERLDANVKAREELRAFLLEAGGAEPPLVFLYNKRDVPDALPVAELEAALNSEGRPSFEAVATTGAGVVETYDAIRKSAVSAVRGSLEQVSPFTVHQTSPDPVRFWTLFRSMHELASLGGLGPATR